MVCLEIGIILTELNITAIQEPFSNPRDWFFIYIPG